MSALRIALVAALVSLAASVHADSVVPLAGDTARAREVWSQFEKWMQAYESADLEGVMAIFDPAVTFSFQGQPDVAYAALRQSYVDDFKTRVAGSAWVPQFEEVYASGDLAFARSHWEFRVPDAQGKPQVKARNRSVDILRRDAKGKWSIFRSLNYPEKG